ncbi:MULTISPECIES: hypothetical protein [unclassified Helicobacter]|uniref:hypothetical protein n=1 Tax=unclassified Helicobacter TaxID=2593540 RepID=UPI000CF06A07|nr:MULTISPECIES: hypothetical protein [unclassified Helicobacter]
MIIVGYEPIAFEGFSKIEKKEQIDTTQGLVWFLSQDDKDFSISSFCMQNNVPYAVKIESIKELLIYAKLNAKYVILQDSPKEYQQIVETYLLDTKILYVIEEIEEIEEIAKMGIDGVIFQKVLY